MHIKRYGRVSMLRDLPEHNLEKGDVATVVDFAKYPATGEPGFKVEIYNAIGELMATLVLAEDDVQPLQFNEVLCVRKALNPIV